MRGARMVGALAAVCCGGASPVSVGSPGPTVDPYLFVLLTLLGGGLLALGVGSLIVIFMSASRRNSRPR